MHKYVRPKDKVLMVGCGNSKLSQDLYDVGYRQICNIDISPVVIKQMVEANRSRPEMSWQQMDATAMEFEPDTFSTVIDKGTLDAMLTDASEEVVEKSLAYLKEATRVLNSVGGRFVCVSLLQAHILKLVVEYFPSQNFMLRVVRCQEAERKTAETSNKGQVMPVYVIVATKFKALPRKVIETCFVEEQIQRLSNEEELIKAVEAVQQSAMVQNGLVKNTQAALNQEIELELHKPGVEAPRFIVHVLDQSPVRGNGKFACFVVPQGRETEWIFCTSKGRRNLLSSVKHDRLAVVSMNREHSYASLEDVQRELDPYITSIAPHGLTDKIPYLSLGTDVGQRQLVCKGSSDFSGPYIVEDVLVSEKRRLRRLIFLNNQFTIQSEAALKLIKTKGGSKTVIDKTYLSCQHHLYMAVGLNLVDKADGRNLIVGLGGGALCSFIQQCFPEQQVVAVEIDPAILNVATEYFGLVVTENLEVKIQDGLEFLKEAATVNISQPSFSSILFDVDSKDSSLGISCPPKSFLEPAVLDSVKKLIGDTGIFILNLVCRDDDLRAKVVSDIKRCFASVCAFKLDEDLNEILYCKNINVEESEWVQAIEKSAKQLNRLAKKQKISNKDLVDVKELIEGLKI